MPIYMRYDGIVGEVTTKPYQGWIELQSAQIGTGRVGRPVSEIIATKVMDRTSPQFNKASLWSGGKDATIDFVDADGTLYLRLELKGTLVSCFNPANSGGGAEQPGESLTFTFTKITSTPQAQLKDKKQALHSMEFKKVQQRMAHAGAR
jgi:type VI secretion system secreted protein Hcp